MGDKIHIALAANHRYLPGLLVTMASMIRSATAKDRLLFHIFSDGLSAEDKARVSEAAKEFGAGEPEFHEPDMTPLKNLLEEYRSSQTASLRLFFCRMLEVDWIVYSDVDTLWLRDVCELWELRDESVSVQWCRDLPSIQEGVKGYTKWNLDFDSSKYSCSGVLLMNLRRMRDVGFDLQCIDFVKKWGTPFFPDQDILNYICRNDEKELPGYWDCLNPTREAVNGLVYHFNGIGLLFNSDFSGWRPLYYPWFRFYYDFITKEPRRPVCGRFKRFIFWLLGSFYPSRKFFSCFLNPFLTDNVTRQLFFAWLWRHAKWRW